MQDNNNKLLHNDVTTTTESASVQQHRRKELRDEQQHQREKKQERRQKSSLPIMTVSEALDELTNLALQPSSLSSPSSLSLPCFGSSGSVSAVVSSHSETRNKSTGNNATNDNVGVTTTLNSNISSSVTVSKSNNGIDEGGVGDTYSLSPCNVSSSFRDNTDKNITPFALSFSNNVSEIDNGIINNHIHDVVIGANAATLPSEATLTGAANTIKDDNKHVPTAIATILSSSPFSSTCNTTTRPVLQIQKSADLASSSLSATTETAKVSSMTTTSQPSTMSTSQQEEQNEQQQQADKLIHLASVTCHHLQILIHALGKHHHQHNGNANHHNNHYHRRNDSSKTMLNNSSYIGNYDPSHVFSTVQKCTDIVHRRYLYLLKNCASSLKTNNNIDNDKKQKIEENEKHIAANIQNNKSSTVVPAEQPISDSNVIITSIDAVSAKQLSSVRAAWLSVWRYSISATATLSYCCVGPAWHHQLQNNNHSSMSRISPPSYHSSTAIPQLNTNARANTNNSNDSSHATTSLDTAPTTRMSIDGIKTNDTGGVYTREEERSTSSGSIRNGIPARVLLSNNASEGKASPPSLMGVDAVMQQNYHSIPEALPAAMLRFAALIHYHYHHSNDDDNKDKQQKCHSVGGNSSSSSSGDNIGCKRLMPNDEATEMQLIGDAQRMLVLSLCCGTTSAISGSIMEHPNDSNSNSSNSSHNSGPGDENYDIEAVGYWTIPGALHPVSKMLCSWIESVVLDLLAKDSHDNQNDDEALGNRGNSNKGSVLELYTKKLGWMPDDSELCEKIDGIDHCEKPDPPDFGRKTQEKVYNSDQHHDYYNKKEKAQSPPDWLRTLSIARVVADLVAAGYRPPIATTLDEKEYRNDIKEPRLGIKIIVGLLLIVEKGLMFLPPQCYRPNSQFLSAASRKRNNDNNYVCAKAHQCVSSSSSHDETSVMKQEEEEIKEGKHDNDEEGEGQDKEDLRKQRLSAASSAAECMCALSSLGTRGTLPHGSLPPVILALSQLLAMAEGDNDGDDGVTSGADTSNSNNRSTNDDDDDIVGVIISSVNNNDYDNENRDEETQELQEQEYASTFLEQRNACLADTAEMLWSLLAHEQTASMAVGLVLTMINDYQCHRLAKTNRKGTNATTTNSYTNHDCTTATNGAIRALGAALWGNPPQVRGILSLRIFWRNAILALGNLGCQIFHSTSSSSDNPSSSLSGFWTPAVVPPSSTMAAGDTRRRSDSTNNIGNISRSCNHNSGGSNSNLANMNNHHKKNSNVNSYLNKRNNDNTTKQTRRQNMYNSNKSGTSNISIQPTAATTTVSTNLDNSCKTNYVVTQPNKNKNSKYNNEQSRFLEPFLFYETTSYNQSSLFTMFEITVALRRLIDVELGDCSAAHSTSDHNSGGSFTTTACVKGVLILDEWNAFLQTLEKGVLPWLVYATNIDNNYDVNDDNNINSAIIAKIIHEAYGILDQIESFLNGCQHYHNASYDSQNGIQNYILDNECRRSLYLLLLRRACPLLPGNRAERMGLAVIKAWRRSGKWSLLYRGGEWCNDARSLVGDAFAVYHHNYSKGGGKNTVVVKTYVHRPSVRLAALEALTNFDNDLVVNIPNSPTSRSHHGSGTFSLLSSRSGGKGGGRRSGSRISGGKPGSSNNIADSTSFVNDAHSVDSTLSFPSFLSNSNHSRRTQTSTKSSMIFGGVGATSSSFLPSNNNAHYPLLSPLCLTKHVRELHLELIHSVLLPLLFMIIINDDDSIAYAKADSVDANVNASMKADHTNDSVVGSQNNEMTATSSGGIAPSPCITNNVKSKDHLIHYDEQQYQDFSTSWRKQIAQLNSVVLPLRPLQYNETSSAPRQDQKEGARRESLFGDGGVGDHSVRRKSIELLGLLFRTVSGERRHRAILLQALRHIIIKSPDPLSLSSSPLSTSSTDTVKTAANHDSNINSSMDLRLDAIRQLELCLETTFGDLPHTHDSAPLIVEALCDVITQCSSSCDSSTTATTTTTIQQQLLLSFAALLPITRLRIAHDDRAVLVPCTELTHVQMKWLCRSGGCGNKHQQQQQKQGDDGDSESHSEYDDLDDDNDDESSLLIAPFIFVDRNSATKNPFTAIVDATKDTIGGSAVNAKNLISEERAEQYTQTQDKAQQRKEHCRSSVSVPTVVTAADTASSSTNNRNNSTNTISNNNSSNYYTTTHIPSTSTSRCARTNLTFTNILSSIASLIQQQNIFFDQYFPSYSSLSSELLSLKTKINEEKLSQNKSSLDNYNDNGNIEHEEYDHNSIPLRMEILSVCLKTISEYLKCSLPLTGVAGTQLLDAVLCICATHSVTATANNNTNSNSNRNNASISNRNNLRTKNQIDSLRILKSRVLSAFAEQQPLFSTRNNDHQYNGLIAQELLKSCGCCFHINNNNINDSNTNSIKPNKNTIKSNPNNNQKCCHDHNPSLQEVVLACQGLNKLLLVNYVATTKRGDDTTVNNEGNNEDINDSESTSKNELTEELQQCNATYEASNCFCTSAWFDKLLSRLEALVFIKEEEQMQCHHKETASTSINQLPTNISDHLIAIMTLLYDMIGYCATTTATAAMLSSSLIVALPHTLYARMIILFYHVVKNTRRAIVAQGNSSKLTRQCQLLALQCASSLLKEVTDQKRSIIIDAYHRCREANVTQTFVYPDNQEDCFMISQTCGGNSAGACLNKSKATHDSQSSSAHNDGDDGLVLILMDMIYNKCFNNLSSSSGKHNRFDNLKSNHGYAADNSSRNEEDNPNHKSSDATNCDSSQLLSIHSILARDMEELELFSVMDYPHNHSHNDTDESRKKKGMSVFWLCGESVLSCRVGDMRFRGFVELTLRSASGFWRRLLRLSDGISVHDPNVCTGTIVTNNDIKYSLFSIEDYNRFGDIGKKNLEPNFKTDHKICHNDTNEDTYQLHDNPENEPYSAMENDILDVQSDALILAQQVLHRWESFQDRTRTNQRQASITTLVDELAFFTVSSSPPEENHSVSSQKKSSSLSSSLFSGRVGGYHSLFSASNSTQDEQLNQQEQTNSIQPPSITSGSTNNHSSISSIRGCSVDESSNNDDPGLLSNTRTATTVTATHQSNVINKCLVEMFPNSSIHVQEIANEISNIGFPIKFTPAPLKNDGSQSLRKTTSASAEQEQQHQSTEVIYQLATGPNLLRAVKVLDRTCHLQTHKIALLFVRTGGGSNNADIYNIDDTSTRSMSAEENILLGASCGSPAFLSFCRALGSLVLSQHLKYFSGGLDTSARAEDGDLALIWIDGSASRTSLSSNMALFHNVIFMPPGQYQRKRHVGNDSVHIVYIEKGDSSLKHESSDHKGIGINIDDIEDKYNDDSRSGLISGHFGFVTIFVVPLLQMGTVKVTLRVRKMSKPTAAMLSHLAGSSVVPWNIAGFYVRQLAVKASLACQSLIEDQMGIPSSNWEERLVQLRQMKRYIDGSQCMCSLT